MWHSIPAAINVGLIALLICSGEDIVPRAFKAGAIVIGFLSHLILDEIWSLDIFRGRVKESSGTALKFWMARHWWPNVLTYGMLFGLIAAAYQHPVIRDGYATWRLEAEQKALAIPAATATATPAESLIPVTGGICSIDGWSVASARLRRFTLRSGVPKQRDPFFSSGAGSQRLNRKPSRANSGKLADSRNADGGP